MAAHVQNPIILVSIVVLFSVHSYQSLRISNVISEKPVDEKTCTAELEAKFLGEEGKCLRSGFIPVKGSCTGYIPCISLGGDLMRPMKRTDCNESAGLAFHIHLLQCRPVPHVDQCAQRLCYPSEAKIEDGKRSTEPLLVPHPVMEEDLALSSLNETVNSSSLNITPTFNYDSISGVTNPPVLQTTVYISRAFKSVPFPDVGKSNWWSLVEVLCLVQLGCLAVYSNLIK